MTSFVVTIVISVGLTCFWCFVLDRLHERRSEILRDWARRKRPS
jgi:hypothetical protein